MKKINLSRKSGAYSRLLREPSRYYSVFSGGNTELKRRLGCLYS